MDGARDMKFTLTAMTIARCRREGTELSLITMGNIEKLTKYRKDGLNELEDLVKKIESGWHEQDISPTF